MIHRRHPETAVDVLGLPHVRGEMIEAGENIRRSPVMAAVLAGLAQARREDHIECVDDCL